MNIGMKIDENSTFFATLLEANWSITKAVTCCDINTFLSLMVTIVFCFRNAPTQLVRNDNENNILRLI